MVQDLTASFVQSLERMVNPLLKKWAGLFKSAELGTLFRSRDNFGLGLTSVTTHFKKMQIVYCLILKKSEDTDIRKLYEHKAEREAKWRTIKASTQLTTEVISQVVFEDKFGGQVGRQGLGWGAHKKPPFRQRCTLKMQDIGQQKLLMKANDLKLQGYWRRFADQVLPLDLSWNSLIYGPGPKLMSFVMNAAINSLPTRDMLCLWGYTKDDHCPLCNRKAKQSLGHILAGCPVALRQKRFTFRHDSVLATLLPILKERIEKHNNSKQDQSEPQGLMVPVPFANSQWKKKSGRLVNRHARLLENTRDWRLLIDFDHKRAIFPPSICPTDQRPDIVIWSESTKTVVMAELTCPMEENMIRAITCKTARYALLVEQIKQAGWSPVLLTVEGGARGFVAKSMRSFLCRLGFTGREANMHCKTLSLVLARCSYYIFLARNTKKWHRPPLVIGRNKAPIRQTDIDNQDPDAMGRGI